MVDMPSRPPSRSTRRPQPARQPSDTQLARTPSSHSFHAGHSLRRMATHETGEFVDVRQDGARMSTHDEHEAEDGASVASASASASRGDARKLDEEAAIESHGAGASDSRDLSAKPDAADDKYALQDQTNLLPWKQVAVIFVGLNCALFCSLLDQTM